MRTFNEHFFPNSVKMLHLHLTGRAAPTGRVHANSMFQWVRTKGGRVIQIGLLLKSEVRV